MKSIKLHKLLSNTAIGNAESVEITEVVTQCSIFEPTMCCTTTAKVNYVGEYG